MIAASSEIGTLRECASCNQSTRVPCSEIVQTTLRNQEQEQLTEVSRWAAHDHIVDPQPEGDINGFFRAVRDYACRHGLLKMAETLKLTGVFTIPATEDHGHNLLALQRLVAADVANLPPLVADALRRLQQQLEDMFPMLRGRNGEPLDP